MQEQIKTEGADSAAAVQQGNSLENIASSQNTFPREQVINNAMEQIKQIAKKNDKHLTEEDDKIPLISKENAINEITANYQEKQEVGETSIQKLRRIVIEKLQIKDKTIEDLRQENQNSDEIIKNLTKGQKKTAGDLTQAKEQLEKSRRANQKITEEKERETTRLGEIIERQKKIYCISRKSTK